MIQVKWSLPMSTKAEIESLALSQEVLLIA